MTTHILGVPASLPLYFTATALAKLAHQEGEVAIVKARELDEFDEFGSLGWRVRGKELG